MIVDGAFLPIFEHLTTRLGAEEMELVSIIAQELWLRRNRVVFGDSVMPPTYLVKCTQETISNFHHATATPNPTPQAPTCEGMEASLVIRIISFPLSVIGMLVLFSGMEMKLPTG